MLGGLIIENETLLFLILGTWVQCSDVTCLKWRYLDDAQDPAELPEYWTCNLNIGMQIESLL